MARVFYIEEIGLAIFTMFIHRKVQTVSVFITNGVVYCSIFVYQIISYHLLYLGVGYSVILLNNYGLIICVRSMQIVVIIQCIIAFVYD